MDSLQSDYRDMLIEVGEYVDENKIYLEAMKFKCKSIIKGKESEGITSSLRLWEALEKREMIGPYNTQFLKELLQTCMKGIMPPFRAVEIYETRLGQHGFNLNQVQNFVPPPHQIPQPHLPQAQPQVPIHVQAGQQREQYNGTQIYDLKKEMTFLSKNLGRDWKNLVRELSVNESIIEDMINEHRSVREQILQCLLFWQLEEQEGATKERLITALKGIERNDLVVILEDGNY